MRVLTPELRKILKKPLGKLIKGQPDYTIEKLKEIIEKEKPSKIISVGDEVTRNMLMRNLKPDVMVIDGKVMRQPIASIQVKTERTLELKNPPGTLSDDAIMKLRQAISMEGTCKVLVKGEEDLLTLIAILHASEGSLVVYGQPLEGIVIVKVNRDSKRMAEKIVNCMEEKKD